MKLRTVTKRRTEPFIKGPLPVLWIACALSLPGQAINVGLALWYWSGILKTRTFELTNHMCQAFGVVRKGGKIQRFGMTRPAKLRALRHLSEAGLITVKWNGQKAPEITILDV